MGTHQGAVSHEYLDYYLDEFTFRFNRRTSRSRGKLFYRLLQQAVAVDPVPYKSIVEEVWAKNPDPRYSSYWSQLHTPIPGFARIDHELPVPVLSLRKSLLPR